MAQWANIPGLYSNQQYIFWLGPMFGAGLAAAIYEYGSLKPANFAGARDMDTALFEAGKRKKHKAAAAAAAEASAPTPTTNPMGSVVTLSDEVSPPSSLAQMQRTAAERSAGPAFDTPSMQRAVSPSISYESDDDMSGPPAGV